jgi:hypothetical protein
MAGTNLKTDSVLATPPLTVAAATLAGFTLQDWVYALTITYTLFLIGEKLFRWWKAWQERKIFRASMDLPDKRE